MEDSGGWLRDGFVMRTGNVRAGNGQLNVNNGPGLTIEGSTARP